MNTSTSPNLRGPGNRAGLGCREPSNRASPGGSRRCSHRQPRADELGRAGHRSAAGQCAASVALPAEPAAKAELPARLPAKSVAKFPAKSVANFELAAKLLAKLAAKYPVFQYRNDQPEVVSLAPGTPAVGGPCPGPQSLGRALVRAEREEMSEMHPSTPCR